ncbi:MAG: acyl-CoA dehydrogenase family protein [Myxococcota bacterium]
MYQLSDDQQALVEATRGFVEDEIGPLVREDDEAERFRPEIMQALGAQGLTGVTTPEAFGGLGLGYVEYSLVLEAIARVSASYAVSVAVTGLPQMILSTFGTDAQRDRYLEGLATGRLLGAFALSEPGSGSDAGALKTTATKRGEQYVLAGSKFWITHGGYADVYVVMARTGGPGPKGVSAFLVDGTAKGLSFGKKEEKMGLRTSPTVEVILDDVVVDESARVGPEGTGFSVAMAALDSGRITIAATSLGICQSALEVATQYASQRRQFETPIIDFQGVGFMLADMAAKTEGARALTHRAAARRDAGLPHSYDAALAKLTATDAAMAVTTDAVQVLGGYGYTREYPVERYMRDAKVMQIVEGTNQIQRLVISRHLKRTYGTDG